MLIGGPSESGQAMDTRLRNDFERGGGGRAEGGEAGEEILSTGGGVSVSDPALVGLNWPFRSQKMAGFPDSY